MGKLLIVEGIIGIGKSTFAKLFAKRFDDVTYLPEPVDGNKVLEEFYKNIPEWSFALQMDFLYKRFQQIHYANTHDGIFVMDRGLSGDAIFVDMLVESNQMHPLKAEIYYNTSGIMKGILKPADFILYLDGSPERAFQQMQDRNRDIEVGVPLEYLQSLYSHYERVFKYHPDPYLEASPIQFVEWYANDEDKTGFLLDYAYHMTYRSWEQ